MKLSDTERLFFSLVRAPTGVNAGLAEQALGADDLAAVIRSDECASSTERLSIYANMYFFRIFDVLKSTFPVTLQYAKSDLFHNWATEYLWLYPSIHPSIGQVGERFAPFLAQKLANQTSEWLVDLAKLEWARYDVFDERDQVSLTAAMLQTMTPEQFAPLPLQFICASRLLQTRVPLETLWFAEEEFRTNRDLSANPALSSAAIHYAVWRRDHQVFHRQLEPLEAQVIRDLSIDQAGNTFGAVCDWLVERRPEKEAAEQAWTLLAQWAADEILRSPSAAQDLP